MGLGSGFRKKCIPDPRSRVKKAPDPGTATLLKKCMYRWRNPLAWHSAVLLSTPLSSPPVFVGIVCLAKDMLDLYSQKKDGIQKEKKKKLNLKNSKLSSSMRKLAS